jgi:hypothetical protein
MASATPFVLMALGGLSLVRGLFRPHRAVVREGAVSRCAGPNQYKVCDSTDTVQTPPGASAYATASGRVIAAGDTFVHVAVHNEPVILMYDGVRPTVDEGQYVGRGQKLGESTGAVTFGVWQMAPTARGAVMQKVPASAWLAARGLKFAVSDTGPGTKWCEGGRSITVPQSVTSACDLRQPDPATFALLPVSINME